MTKATVEITLKFETEISLPEAFRGTETLTFQALIDKMVINNYDGEGADAYISFSSDSPVTVYIVNPSNVFKGL